MSHKLDVQCSFVVQNPLRLAGEDIGYIRDPAVVLRIWKADDREVLAYCKVSRNGAINAIHRKNDALPTYRATCGISRPTNEVITCGGCRRDLQRPIGLIPTSSHVNCAATACRSGQIVFRLPQPSQR